MTSRFKKKKRVFSADTNKLKERLDCDYLEQYTYCGYCVKKYEMSLASRDVKCIIRKKLKKHTTQQHPGMKAKEFKAIKPKKKKLKSKSKRSTQKHKKQKSVCDLAGMVIIQCKLIFIQFLACKEFDILASCLSTKDRKDIAKFWRQYETKENKQERENKLIATLQSYETDKYVDGMAVIDKMKYSVSLVLAGTKGSISKNLLSMQWAHDRNSMSFWSYFKNSNNSKSTFKIMFEMKNPNFFDIHTCQKIDLTYWYTLYKTNDGKYCKRPAWISNKCLVDILHELLLPSLQGISKIFIGVGRYSMSHNTRRSTYSESFRNYYVMWAQHGTKEVKLLQIKYHTANGEYDY